MKARFRLAAKSITAALIAGAAMTATGCSANAPEDTKDETKQVSVTRTKTYSSLDELNADSTLIVTGTPTSQEIVQDIDPDMDFTLSTFEVQSTQKGEASGVITVRQTGSTRQTPPTGILGVGQRYLLYLTPSGLSGEQASQFYVTGMNAGIYKASEGAQTGGETSSGSTFTQADPDPADKLPPHIEIP